MDLIDNLTPDWLVPPTLIAFAVDGALMAAGIPPDIPNIDELMSQGAGYLANMAAEQVMGPAAGQITGELASEFLGESVAGLAQEEVERRVREETRGRLKQGILEGAEEMRAALARDAAGTTCSGRTTPAQVTITVRNSSREDYRDLSLAVADGENIFAANSVRLAIAAGESLTIPIPLQAVPRTAQKSQLVGHDRTANMNHWWQEVYAKLSASFEVRAPGAKTCYPDPAMGERCQEVTTNTLYVSPGRVWSTAFAARP